MRLGEGQLQGKECYSKKGEWGFTVANFNTMVPFGYESFAFPIHCNQVFFSDVEDEPGWRVLLRTEVRGRRIDNNIEEDDINPMFAMGADIDFEGLRAPDVIPETHPDPLPTGRDIRLNDILNEVMGEQAAGFDRDVGESSEEGE